MVEIIAIPPKSVAESRIIVVPQGKREVIHDLVSDSSQSVTEIIVEDQADLNFIYEQQIKADAYVENTYRIVLGANATATIFFLLQGSAHCQVSCDIVLEKPGSSAQFKGLYAVNDKRSVEFCMRQQHSAANTKSVVVVKGVVRDEANVVFNGTIAVNKAAYNSNAELQNKNLVLNERARVISKPCLEILADAVRCKHGSAVGTFDAEHLFYVRSRGLDEDQAKREILAGFSREFFDSLPDGEIQERWHNHSLVVKEISFVKFCH